MNKIDKANKSQRIVIEKLLANGFTIAEVKSPTANGIDIVAIKDNEHLEIEVKTVSKTDRAWRVTKPNIHSTYIAVVMPNGLIHWEYASDWMKNCSKDGSRRVTNLVRLYNLFDVDSPRST